MGQFLIEKLMRKAGHSFIPKEVAILIVVLILASTATLAQAQQPSNSTPDSSLREFIRHYLGEPMHPPKRRDQHNILPPSSI